MNKTSIDTRESLTISTRECESLILMSAVAVHTHMSGECGRQRPEYSTSTHLYMVIMGGIFLFVHPCQLSIPTPGVLHSFAVLAVLIVICTGHQLLSMLITTACRPPLCAVLHVPSSMPRAVSMLHALHPHHTPCVHHTTHPPMPCTARCPLPALH